MQGTVKLLYKRGDRLDPANYRPITISRALSKVFSKLITERLTDLVESNVLLSDFQYGFREGRSTQDCIFILNTCIAKARTTKQDIHAGFLDLTSAYDRVNRKVLFEACGDIGLGPKSINLIRSLYTEDSVSYEVQNVVSDPLYLTKGVRQGCQSSPILWNVYLKKVIDKLNASKLGVELGDKTITALAFADDIAVIGQDAKSCKKAIAICVEECEKIGMLVNKKKSKVISGSEIGTQSETSIIPLEQVESFGYLGAKIRIEPRKLYQPNYGQSCRTKASVYRGSSISLAAHSPDPIMFATRIWSCCAIPAILYASEVMLIKEADLNKIAIEQHRVMRYCLQVPGKSTNTAAQHALGMKQIKAIYYERVLSYFCKVRSAPYDSLVHRAFRTNKEIGSHYWKHVRRISKKVNWDGDQATIKSSIKNFCIKHANEARLEHIKTMFPFPEATAQNIFMPLPNLDFSEDSKTTNRFLLLNTGLGNRAPIKDGRSFKNCPLCGEKLNEVHLLMTCVPLEPMRIVTGIRRFIDDRNGLTSEELYKEFWNVWSISKATKGRRAQAAKQMLDTYMVAIN